jgi:type IV pilus assembly protein PilY1
MKRKFNIRYLFNILILVVISISSTQAFALMGKYCATPPFITARLKPNVLIMLDNSGSMKEPMYSHYQSSSCS